MRRPIVFTTGFVTLCMASLGSAQTWTFDPDLNMEPNAAGQPFEGGTVGGGNETRSFIDLGGGDLVYQINTIDPNTDAGSYFEQGDGPRWNVSNAAGHTTLWRIRLDPAFPSEDGSADLLACDGTAYPVMRLIHDAGKDYVRLRLMNIFGQNILEHRVPDADIFHTYRLDVQNDNVSVYVDDYPFPVLTNTGFTGAGGYDFIRFGDGTGSGDGKHQTDLLASYQAAKEPAPAPRDPLDTDNTLFLAHYDGSTGNGGLDADFGVGGTAAVDLGGAIDAAAKFGAGSLDGYNPSGLITYPAPGNYNVTAGTIEMWVKPNAWNGGSYEGFFDLYQPGVVDIRLQKTSSGQLQAYVNDQANGTLWSITSPAQMLDSNWHHIAWSWDYNVSVSALHIDGVPVATASALSNLDTIDFNGSLAPTFQVGTLQAGSASFNGLIDDLRISAVALYGGASFTPPSAAFPDPPTDPLAACCLPNETCNELTFSDCGTAGGTWQGIGVACVDVDCSIPTGACCLPGGTCAAMTGEDCDAQHGEYHGNGTDCINFDCAQFGACCLPDGSCDELYIGDCVGRNGAFEGNATICDATSCPAPTPTWIYDADDNQIPNEVGQPFVSPGFQFGANAFRDLFDLGGGDYVLRVDTLPQGNNNSIGWQINGGGGTNWDVDAYNGYSVEWRVRMDPGGEPTAPGACVTLAGNTDNFAAMRVYDIFDDVLRVAVQDINGGSGEVVHAVPDRDAWHTYRLDVRDSTAWLFLDDYPWPVLSKPIAAGGANAVWFGDGTGEGNGRYQVDYVSSYQLGALGIQNAPDPTDVVHTLFLAHYDGDTAQGGLDADYARGSPVALGTGGLIDAAAKFGAGSLDGLTATGQVAYSTPQNYNLNRGTIEMWILPLNWSDGQFAGFMDIVNGNDVQQGDIRLQKTNGQSLQAVMRWDITDPAPEVVVWSLTSEPLALDATWHHIAWTWDFAANRSALYVDGAVVDSTITTTGSRPFIEFGGTVQPTFQIGTVQSGSAAFNGFIDEVRVSDVDLYGGVAFAPADAAFDSPAGGGAGACCRPNGFCEGTSFAACLGFNGIWQGSGTTCGQVICTPFNDPYADRDFDGDVDQADFAAFQLCVTGAGGGILTGCDDFDRDGDLDVDNDDYLDFVACSSGPNVPADKSCDD